MIDPFAFSKSLREAWVIAKTVRGLNQFGWRRRENAFTSNRWMLTASVLVSDGGNAR
tara:strand:- start:16 stop:186 length:171 start_codon:yes stop_codon:yes gene_type:complete